MNIAVLLGGYSAERNVSLASGLRIAGALRARGHAVTCVDPAAVDARGVLTREEEARVLAAAVGAAPPSLDELERLGRGGGAGIPPALADWPAVRGADVVLLALHGGQGEDGTLQALLDLAGVRYSGSGHLGSALAMDKHRSKLVFRAAGVGTADWRMAPLEGGVPPTAAGERDAFAAAVEAALGLPVIVKPSKQGSSVALTVVRERGTLWPAIELAARYDDEVMVEAFVPGRELTVGILGDRALPAIEILPSHEVYDYECKYTPGMTEERVAELPAAVAAELQRQARLAFEALGLRGYARVDFRLRESGADGSSPVAYCLEVNTLPGMTELSLLPQGAAAAGLDFGALCEEIVRLAAGGPAAAGTVAPARGF